MFSKVILEHDETVQEMGEEEEPELQESIALSDIVSAPPEEIVSNENKSI